MPTNTFSLATLPPPALELEDDHLEKVKKVSRERYSEKVDIVTDKIKRWSAPKRLEDDEPLEIVKETKEPKASTSEVKKQKKKS